MDDMEIFPDVTEPVTLVKYEVLYIDSDDTETRKPVYVEEHLATKDLATQRLMDYEPDAVEVLTVKELDVIEV